MPNFSIGYRVAVSSIVSIVSKSRIIKSIFFRGVYPATSRDQWHEQHERNEQRARNEQHARNEQQAKNEQHTRNEQHARREKRARNAREAKKKAKQKGKQQLINYILYASS